MHTSAAMVQHALGHSAFRHFSTRGWGPESGGAATEKPGIPALSECSAHLMRGRAKRTTVERARQGFKASHPGAMPSFKATRTALVLLAVLAMTTTSGASRSQSRSAKPLINATNLQLYAGQKEIGIVGKHIPKLKSSWNITLRASGPSSVPQPTAKVKSVGQNGTSAILTITGLQNFHVGPLLARMNVNTRTHRFSTE